MAGGLVAYLKGVAKAAITVDDQVNALPVAPLAGVPWLVEAEAVATAADPAYAEGAIAPISQDRTGHLRIQAASATGAAVTANANYNGLNVVGTLRGWSGVNPSGTIFAGQVDLASVAGATVKTGAGTAAGSIRVELPTDGTGQAAAMATATAAAPAYVEASTNRLSQNLTGDLRVIAKQSGAWTISTTPTPSATGTQTSVASNVASQAILAANAARLGATVTNDGSNNLYLRLNAGAASATTYTVKLVAGAYYEVPTDYVGAITGIWDVATGSARVTELT